MKLLSHIDIRQRSMNKRFTFWPHRALSILMHSIRFPVRYLAICMKCILEVKKARKDVMLILSNGDIRIDLSSMYIQKKPNS